MSSAVAALGTIQPLTSRTVVPKPRLFFLPAYSLDLLLAEPVLPKNAPAIAQNGLGPFHGSRQS